MGGSLLLPVNTFAYTNMPVLSIKSKGFNRLLTPGYDLALKTLLDICTQSYDTSYNKTGLLTPGKFIVAGGDYPTPWTRDAGIMCYDAGNLLEPAEARNTLLAVCIKQASGKLCIQTWDNQWWDKVIWVNGAWNYYLVTGDKTFLANAYEVTTESLADMEKNHFNATYGLFKGPSCINDGIAAFPEPPYSSTAVQYGWVLDYPETYEIMTLSSNCVHYNAYILAAKMAQELAKGQTESNAWNTKAAALKSAINTRFWIPASNRYGYLIHGNGVKVGMLDDYQEALGLSFSIIFGVADSAKTSAILAYAHKEPWGIPHIYPHFARYSDAKPGRHNNIIWGVSQGAWAHAAVLSGRTDLFSEEIQSIATLGLMSDNNYREVYNCISGLPDGGWQASVNGEAHCYCGNNQGWTATGFLKGIYSGLFGMRFSTDGIRFAPTLPFEWNAASLRGVKYRGMTLNLELTGCGNRIDTVRIDGVIATEPFVAANLTGEHTIAIYLAGGTVPVGDRYEVEDGERTGSCYTDSGSWGYSGKGFIGGIDRAVGNAVSLTINASVAGDHSFDFRYSNGTSANSTLSISINGEPVKKVTFPKTGAWDKTWGTVTSSFSLKAGQNIVKILYNAGDGATDLDYLSVSGSGGSTQVRPATRSTTRQHPEIISRLTTIELKGISSFDKINVYSLSGKKLLSTTNRILSTNTLGKGIYFVSVSGSGLATKRLIIDR
jgi:hypothetical protein